MQLRRLRPAFGSPHACFGAAAVAALVALSACGGADIQAPADDGDLVAAGCQDATLPSSAALYRVCFPETWNGDLVIYAHGYVSAGAPLAIPDDKLAGKSVGQIVTGLGYAYATTSYRANGLVADLAVDDVAQLAEEVRRRFRPDPVRSYVVGVSEGGLVAALVAERRAELFDGGVAAWRRAARWETSRRRSITSAISAWCSTTTSRASSRVAR